MWAFQGRRKTLAPLVRVVNTSSSRRQDSLSLLFRNHFRTTVMLGLITSLAVVMSTAACSSEKRNAGPDSGMKSSAGQVLVRTRSGRWSTASCIRRSSV